MRTLFCEVLRKLSRELTADNLRLGRPSKIPSWLQDVEMVAVQAAEFQGGFGGPVAAAAVAERAAAPRGTARQCTASAAAAAAAESTAGA